jgi:hypothetical protein
MPAPASTLAGGSATSVTWRSGRSGAIDVVVDDVVVEASVGRLVLVVVLVVVVDGRDVVVLVDEDVVVDDEVVVVGRAVVLVVLELVVVVDVLELVVVVDVLVVVDELLVVEVEDDDEVDVLVDVLVVVEHPPIGGWVQAPAPLQTSLVHGFPSLGQPVPAGSKHVLPASLHVAAHTAPPAHGLPACNEHPLPLQVSAPLQNDPSSHGRLFGAKTQPFAPHESVVQGLPSSQASAVYTMLRRGTCAAVPSRDTYD